MVSKSTEILRNLILESLHPELQNIITEKNSNKTTQSQLASKIKELHDRVRKLELKEICRWDQLEHI